MSWVGVTAPKDHTNNLGMGQGTDTTESSMDSNLQDVHLEGDVEHQAVSIGEVGAPTHRRYIKSKKHTRRLQVVLAALAIVFLFCILLRWSSLKKNTNSSSSAAPIPDGNDEIDLSGASIREAHLIILVHDIAVDESERVAVTDEKSPQRQAIRWLADEDPMNIEIPETRFDTAYPAFLQRYSSAVLAFTFGPDLLKPLGFLSGSRECDWNADFSRPDGSTLTQGLICNTGEDVIIKVVLQTIGLKNEIPMELGNLHSISHLHLDENNLIGKLPHTLRRLSRLREFTVTRNKLTGHIPPFLAKMKALRHAELSKNSFSGHLKAFDSSENEDETADFEASPLRVLALDNNKFSGPLDALKSLTMLEELYVNDNALTGHIGGTFTELSQLAIFIASNNKLSKKIPDYLLQLPSMTILDLSNNLLGTNFPHGNATTLKYLDLHNNQLSSVLPHSIGQHPNLAYLDLSQNLFEGSLIEELGHLTSLQYLFLQDNPGLEAGPVPDWILQLPILESLSLKNTGRTGELPEWLGHLTTLSLLDLSKNALVGSIPSMLANAESLEYILLSRNELSGEVPVTMGNLTELNLLNLDHNALTGTLPSEICELDPAVLIADCDTSNGQPEPLIECPCCTKCCLTTVDDCNTRDWGRKFGDDWGGYYERFNIVEDGDVYELIDWND